VTLDDEIGVKAMRECGVERMVAALVIGTISRVGGE
jgi:hypothetical protein